MLLSHDRFRPLHKLSGAVAMTGAALLGLLSTGAGVQIVTKAAGIPTTADGVGGVVNGANALVTPILVIMAAIAPIGILAGGAAMMLGSRRGMQMIATSLGVLLVLGSVMATIRRGEVYLREISYALGRILPAGSATATRSHCGRPCPARPG